MAVSAAEIARQTGVPHSTVKSRLRKGLSAELAGRKVSTLSQAARAAGISPSIVYDRIYRGWTLEEALKRAGRPRVSPEGINVQLECARAGIGTRDYYHARKKGATVEEALDPTGFLRAQRAVNKLLKEWKR